MGVFLNSANDICRRYVRQNLWRPHYALFVVVLKAVLPKGKV